MNDIDEGAVERLVASAEEQGFPRQCSDPTILGEIVTVLREAAEKKKGSDRMDAAKHRALPEVSDDGSPAAAASPATA